jgi:hypothetical protein
MLTDSLIDQWSPLTETDRSLQGRSEEKATGNAGPPSPGGGRSGKNAEKHGVRGVVKIPQKCTKVTVRAPQRGLRNLGG